MAYVIFGDPVLKAPVEKLQDTFVAQGVFDDYIKAQSQIIYDRDEFYRVNIRSKHIKPNIGYRYAEIPDEPFKVQNKSLVEGLPAIFTYYGNMTFVNAQARDVLESVEPNVHQYIPVEFINPNSGPKIEPYWVVNVCTRMVATNLEKSNLKVKEIVDFTDYPDGRYTKFFGKKLPCMTYFEEEYMVLKLNKDVLAGRAIWVEWKLGYGFLTDAFVEALRQAGIEPDYAHNDFHAEEI